MKAALLLLVLALAGCGDRSPPVPTAEESARLDQADAMLNEAETNEKVRR